MGWWERVMSPAFRDLRGRPVDETSSQMLPGSGRRGPELDEPERLSIREATERVAAAKRRDLVGDDDQTARISGHAAAGATISRGTVSDDVAALLDGLDDAVADLDVAATTILQRVELARTQMTALRARAEQDAAALARFAQVASLLKGEA